MRTRILFACIGVAILSLSLAGCAVSLSGSASMNADGSGVVLEGADPITVAAAQPQLAAQPPPPPPRPVRKAKVVGKKIEITEKVMFDYNKATIKVESDNLLTDVAKVLKEHGEIAKIRIEGHTDGDGSASYNKKLSQKRANAVRDFLAKAGIQQTRMESVGFGLERPIASNDTDEGKEKNRRVEFNILAGSKEAAEAKLVKGKKPAAKGKKPAAKEMKPAAKEMKPAAKEKKPAAEEKKPKEGE